MTEKRIDDGGPAFPSEQGYTPEHGWNQTWESGMTLRQWYAGTMQEDDRLVRCIRAMDDTTLQLFALHPDAEREEWITETGYVEVNWHGMTEVAKVATRLQMEARAIARVRFMQADAMIAHERAERGE